MQEPSSSSPRQPRRVGALVAGAICLVLGLLILLGSWLHIRDGVASENWPHAQGTVEESRVVRVGRTLYNARILYTYTVDGERYSGTQICVGGWSTSDYDEALAKTDRYPVNSQQPVYYHPDDPAHAVLEPGATRIQFVVAYVIGPVVLLVGVGALLRWALQFRRK